jgi:ADP-heptose:LPS heptosyltransferase
LNISSARWLDRYIGKPVCFILTCCRKIKDLFLKKDHTYQKPSKIAIIKLIEQGSTVLAYPAIKKAIEIVGDENVYFVVFKKNRPIIDLLNILSNDNIIEIDSHDLRSLIISFIKAVFKMRSYNIDTVVDFEFFMRGSAIIGFLSKAEKRIGMHIFKNEGPYRGDLFTHRMLYNPHIHVRQAFYNLIEAVLHKPSEKKQPMKFVQSPVPDINAVYEPDEEAIKDIKAKIERVGSTVIRTPIIILNPNTSDLLPLRRWPNENFISLGNKLSAEYPKALIILTGTEEEKTETDGIAFHINNAVSMAGKTNMKELLTLYYISDVLVSNDSGPAHFASLTKIKSLILFGPETPELYGPAAKNAKVIVSGLVCSPCLDVFNFRDTACKHNKCLEDISVNTVLENVRIFLSDQ